MRATPSRIVRAIFIFSVLSFIVTSFNFLFKDDNDFDQEAGFNNDMDEFDSSYKSHIDSLDFGSNRDAVWNREEHLQIMDELVHGNKLFQNGSQKEADIGLPANWTFSDIESTIWKRNHDQAIHNLDKFDLVVSESTIVIVVQVHNRPNYLHYLVKSLSRARDIENTLVIFSHDFYSEELNRIVMSINFCPFMQVYYPFSMQLYPNVFPGEDPRDCPRNATREWAMENNCSNKDWPDRYGHYREAKYSQTKHHWFWKINHIFDYLDVTRNFDGPVLFVEEDHYLVADFVSILLMMYRLKTRSCADCNVMTLGTYDKKPTYGAISAQVDVMTFLSSKHNMGMSLTRKTWNEIKTCGQNFCHYDDYNWDWSLNYIGRACMVSKLKTMVMKSPRIYHIGECGLHAKGKNCNPADRVAHIEELLRDNSEFLFPKRVYVGGFPTIPRKLMKPNGGWGDARDHQLCFSFLDAKSHILMNNDV